MTQFKTTAVGLFMLLALPVFAQLQKGNYSFGGDVSLMGAFEKDGYIDTKTFNVALSPSISKFLTNKWAVGVRPILSNLSYDETYRRFADDHLKYLYKNTVTRVGLEVSSRYYFNEGGNFKVFGFMNAAYDRTSTYAYLKQETDAVDDNSKANFINFQAGLGTNYFLNNEVALEGTLSYKHAEVPETFGTLQVARVVPSEQAILNVKMANFINFSDKTATTKTSEDAPQYLTAGRQTVGGNLLLGIRKEKNINFIYETLTTLQLNAQFSHMLTNKLMVMGEFNGMKTLQNNRVPITATTATVAARYYMPVRNRLFVYPQLGYTYKSGKATYDGSVAHLIGLGIGGSYFLTNNIALDATLLQGAINLRNKFHSDIKTLSSTIGLSNVGLIYFIR